jgi:hypothetical protein
MTSEDNGDRLLSRCEVEARFGISKRYLEVRAARGEGPNFIRFGRMVLTCPP